MQRDQAPYYSLLEQSQQPETCAPIINKLTILQLNCKIGKYRNTLQALHTRKNEAFQRAEANSRVRTTILNGTNLSTCLSVQVILGGGRQYMFPDTAQDPEYPKYKGVRKDGQDLVSEWLKNKKVW